MSRRLDKIKENRVFGKGADADCNWLRTGARVKSPRVSQSPHVSFINCGLSNCPSSNPFSYAFDNMHVLSEIRRTYTNGRQPLITVALGGVCGQVGLLVHPCRMAWVARYLLGSCLAPGHASGRALTHWFDKCLDGILRTSVIQRVLRYSTKAIL